MLLWFKTHGERVCQALLWLAMAAYVAVFLTLTFRLFHQFSVMGYDLGIFD